MWIVCITSVRHVLTVNGYGGRQTKENEKSWCFKGWETLDNNYSIPAMPYIFKLLILDIFSFGLPEIVYSCPSIVKVKL